MSLAEAQDHRAEQRQRILAAAATCFARHGFHGTSMQQVCSEAAMSPGALYRYFPSKEAIIAAIVEEERTERARLFDTLARSNSIIAGLVACVEELLTSPRSFCAQLGPEIMAEGARNPKLRDLLAPFERETHQMLRDLLEEAQRRREIAADVDLDTLLVVFMSMGDGLILNHQMSPHLKIVDRLPAISALISRMIAPADSEVPA